MSKAMLIIDEPRVCGECPCYEDFSGCCKKERKYISTLKRVIIGKKPEWCPLRPAPTFKEDNSVIYLERYEGYLEGWNDCVREMLGGGE